MQEKPSLHRIDCDVHTHDCKKTVSGFFDFGNPYLK